MTINLNFLRAASEAASDPAIDAIVRAERLSPGMSAVAILRKADEVYVVLRAGESRSNQFTVADHLGYLIWRGTVVSYSDLAYSLLRNDLGDFAVEPANKENEQGAKRLARLLKERLPDFPQYG